MSRGVEPGDLVHMAEAIFLASRPRRRPWPNPPVGALVVRDGEVVGRGAHQGPGTAHAEAVALAEAGPRARGATLYCTLEPCNHHGRVPPCAPAVVRSGIARVVTGVADPNPRVCGGGFEVLRDAGIDVVNGALAEPALELIWPFAVTDAFERPYVVLKTAVSLDGRFAPAGMRASSGPSYLTGLDARRDVHRLRRWADVVLVGSRTAIIDRPRLDTRLLDETDACPAGGPLPAYVTADPGSADPFAGRRHVAFTGESGAAPGGGTSVAGPLATTVPCRVSNGLVDLESLVGRFRQIGCCLMVEGGPALAASFLRAGLVDRWVAYTAPVVLGNGVTWPGAGGAASELPGHTAPPVEYTLTRVERCGRDVKAVFDRRSFWETLEELSR